MGGPPVRPGGADPHQDAPEGTSSAGRPSSVSAARASPRPTPSRSAVQALVSYQHSAVQDGNEALARVWGEVVAEHAATGTPPAAPVAEPEPQPTEVAVAVAVPGAPGVARPGPVAVDWVHAVTLPPRRLGQLGSLDRALEPIGPFATVVLAAHLVATLPAGDPDRDRLAERAALAGYLVELDLAGVTPDVLPEPDGPDLRLAAVRAATDELTSFDLGALARRHSPAASSVAERLAGEDAGSERQDLVARSLGAGLALAARRRPRADRPQSSCGADSGISNRGWRISSTWMLSGSLK